MYKYYYETPIGRICIEEDNGFITKIDITSEENHIEERETELIKKAYEQLKEYFKGKRRTFNIPLKVKGTDFQKKVWNQLLKIPYGETCTYKDIAIGIGNEKACRAVGGANNKNSIIIVIPCHRVIGKNGDLVGYACGLDVKSKLLEIEKNNK